MNKFTDTVKCGPHGATDRPIATDRSRVWAKTQEGEVNHKKWDGALYNYTAREKMVMNPESDADSIDPNKVKIFKSVFNPFSKEIDSIISNQLNAAYKISLAEDTWCDKLEKQHFDSHDDPLSIQSTYMHDVPNAKRCTCLEFIDFLAESKNPTPFIKASSVAIGFFEKSVMNPIVYFCRISDVSAFWTPKSEIHFERELNNEYKNDPYIGNFYETTSKHKKGSGWVGIVEINRSNLSTVLGGARHPIQGKFDPYVIRWVKWAEQKKYLESVNRLKLTHYIQEGIIAVTDPDAKQSLNIPSSFRPEMLNSRRCLVKKKE